MKGIILKDFLLIKGNARTILIFLLVFGLIALEGNDFLYFVPAFISMMMFMTTFSYDEYNKWDAYAISLPIKKKELVLSKYVGSILLLAIALLGTFLIAFLVGLVNQDFDIQKTLSLLLGCGASILLLQAFMYPLLIKFGVEKGRIGLFVGIFLLSFLVGFLMKNISLTIPENLTHFLHLYLPWILLILVFLVTFISYQISKRIYVKKEF